MPADRRPILTTPAVRQMRGLRTAGPDPRGTGRVRVVGILASSNLVNSKGLIILGILANDLLHPVHALDHPATERRSTTTGARPTQAAALGPPATGEQHPAAPEAPTPPPPPVTIALPTDASAPRTLGSRASIVCGNRSRYSVPFPARATTVRRGLGTDSPREARSLRQQPATRDSNSRGRFRRHQETSGQASPKPRPPRPPHACRPVSRATSPQPIGAKQRPAEARQTTGERTWSQPHPRSSEAAPPPGESAIPRTPCPTSLRASKGSTHPYATARTSRPSLPHQDPSYSGPTVTPRPRPTDPPRLKHGPTLYPYTTQDGDDRRPRR